MTIIAQQASREQSSRGGGDDSLNIVDFKTAQPEAFRGRREESWKTWSRGFRTYCNIKKTGFRQALEWAENFGGEVIDGDALDTMQWGPARLADAKLFDFLSIICKDDAHMLVDQFEGMGFEAWRQLSRRYSPSGGQFELDMMGTLMNPRKAAKISDLPGEIQRFERNIRVYESKTGRAFPLEWKAPTFLKILPDSHKEELVRRFQMGTRDYDTLVNAVRGFSQEAWFSQRGPNDMQVDALSAGQPKHEGFEFQKWTQDSTWEDFTAYWEQQHQGDEELDYLGRRKGGKGKGKGKGVCYWCGKGGHMVKDCHAKAAGKPQTYVPPTKGKGRGAGSLEQEVGKGDYEESMLGCGSVEWDCGNLELDVGLDVLGEEEDEFDLMGPAD